MKMKTSVFTGGQDMQAQVLARWLNEKIEAGNGFRIIAQSMCMVPNGVCILITYSENR